ncbi:chaperonin 10-like protein [Mycena galopus ATCC 62051]|nr:chaperonin 10-like protein [Mycena galopus ATCC 62051]
MSSIPATRQAIGIQKTGDFDVLELLTLPLTVDGGDIVVKAEWLGVNFIDTYFRKGLYPLKELPGAIGAEMSGTILALPTDETVLEDPEYRKRGFTVGAKVAVGGASVVGIHSNVASAPWKVAFVLPSNVSTRTAAAALSQGFTAFRGHIGRASTLAGRRRSVEPLSAEPADLH